MTSRPLRTYHLGVPASDLHVLPGTGLRTPGIEPGSQAWEACMMPLHYVCQIDIGQCVITQQNDTMNVSSQGADARSNSRHLAELKIWSAVRAVAQASPLSPRSTFSFFNWYYPAISAQICTKFSCVGNAPETVATRMLQTQARTRRQASSSSTDKNRQAQADTDVGTVKHSQAQARRHK